MSQKSQSTIRWSASFEEALAQATRSKRPVMIDFFDPG